MASKCGDALAKLRAARSGEKRTDQYVVQEHDKILKEVDEEEYQRIVQERRDDFVVGSRDFGYGDGGKEIWEDPAAALERNREAAERPPRGAAGVGVAAKAGAAAATQAAPAAKAKEEPPKEGARDVLFQALHAGARGGSGGVMAEPAAPLARDAHQQQYLDDVLKQMCGEIEADGVEAKPTAGGMATDAGRPTPGDAAAGPGAAKRKREGASAAGGRGSKKPSTRKAVKTEAGVPPDGGVEARVAIKEEQAPVVKVKRELEDTQDTDVHMAGMAVKAEPTSPAVKMEGAQAVSVKREVVEALSSGAQLQEWLKSGVCEGVKVEAAAAVGEVEVLSAGAKAPLALQEDGGLWFFFVDAFEDDRSSPPRLYLFGKVQVTATGSGPSTCSCCIAVERMERSVHLLLNVPDLDDQDAIKQVAIEAEAEFDALCREHCPGVKKLRAKLKMRNYAFEKALPYGVGNLPFLKVTCDSNGQMPLLGMYGRTFSHMFGAQTSMLETLLLSRRILGPSWLRLQPGSWTEEAARLSFCAVELRITPRSILAAKTDADRAKLTDMGMPSSSPPLRLLSLSMQTWQRSAQQPHEPVAVACTMHPSVSPDASDSDRELRLGMSAWTAVRRIDSRPLPPDSDKVLPQKGVEHFNSEVALLQALLGKIQDFDPDVITCHNAYGFDLDVLASRMYHLKLQQWQKLGRLRRPKDRVPRVEGRQGAGFWVGNNITAGRLVCDLTLQAKDLLPKLGSYDLPNLARQQLSVSNLQVIEPESLPRFFDSTNALIELSERTYQNTLCVARLVHSLQILPLSKQLTNLAGNLWNMSLQNKRAERNEMLLCHEFHRKKFVLPDRESLLMKKRRMQAEGGVVATGLDDADEQDQTAAAAGPRRGKAAYSGGLVLEPKVGLYDDFVMLLDFNSLYPSIIQEHNICFTTVERPNETQVGQCSGESELLAQTREPDGLVEEGVLPQVLRRLVESRRTVKAAMKGERDPRRQQTLEIRQKALKLTANSMYGCLGFQNSRFYAKPLAALITAKGREALQTTITVVQQELQLDVVYGDTDSVFVNTRSADYDQAMQAAQQIKRSVNKRYKRLEIEIDAVFCRLMLLKKKKYAALKVTDWKQRQFEREIKGLDIVRRDWCSLAKGIGEEILMRVLSDKGKEEVVNWIHNFLTEKGKEMDDLQVPIERFVITKGLTKDPKDYPDAKNQPHVQVALRLAERGKVVRSGQEIEYVICEVQGDAPSNLLADRARHPHDLQLDPTLRIDVGWYKKQQVHPLVSRLLGPVEGTDTVRIAECLGMDGSRFAAAAARAAADGTAPDQSYVEAAGADVAVLFDRRTRWKDFKSGLPGLCCLHCKKALTWKQLLQPDEVCEANSLGKMLRCDQCNEPVQPRRAQNLLTMQLRRHLREYCEGWVLCNDGTDMCVERTRRLTRGQAALSERAVWHEIEYMEYLCEGESGYLGEDDRGVREATAGMKKACSWMLECSSYNWVDCGQIFGGIFGNCAAPAR